MSRKVYSYDPQDTDRKILSYARSNQVEALAILKEVFGASITDSSAMSKPALERIAKLARRLEANVRDLERVSMIPKPKPKQPNFKAKPTRRLNRKPNGQALDGSAG